MLNFLNDYNSVAHPKVLSYIQDAAANKYIGYSTDDVCATARETIRGLIGNDNADVHFLTGGTQTNLSALTAFLRPHEAVIAADTAHINVHETGAIEASGHKILSVPSYDGKLMPEAVRGICAVNDNEHTVKPRLVFISQSTEYGTIYSLAELKSLREVCGELGLLLYLDGARLGAALMCAVNDSTIQDIAALTDAFYIGGTKNGLMFGEALVITNPAIATHFRYIIKQRGGLLAKGFLLGLQFEYALSGGLYFDLAKQANLQADKLRDGLTKLGVSFIVNSPTNQIFPILKTNTVAALAKSVLFQVWGKVDETRTAIRFVTTWHTDDREIDELLDKVRSLS